MNMEYLLPFLWKSKLASHCTLSSGYLTHEPEACTAAAPPLLHKRAARSLRRVSKTNTDSWTPECVSRATRLSQSWLRAEHCPGTSLCPNSCSRLPTSPGHWAMSGWRQLAAVRGLMMHKPLTVTSPSLPFAPSLLPKQENPADKDHQCYIFIHGQKSHPYCTPIAITIIKEAFGSWTLFNWHKAVMDRS